MLNAGISRQHKHGGTVAAIVEPGEELEPEVIRTLTDHHDGGYRGVGAGVEVRAVAGSKDCGVSLVFQQALERCGVGWVVGEAENPSQRALIEKVVENRFGWRVIHNININA